MSADPLLGYYERELHLFRRYAQEYAERYPRIAGHLQLAADACADPHVERMIQAYALMSARLAKRLDDDYPQFTEALFESLYPHYLRPFPACAIAEAALGPEGVGEPAAIARGARFASAPVQGVACGFRSVYGVTLLPLRVAQARFEGGNSLPPSAGQPENLASGIVIELESTRAGQPLPACAGAPLRVYIDGDPSFCGALRDALFMHAVCAHVRQPGGAWRRLPALPIAPAGFDDGEALLPTDARSHPAYRLIGEYFAFPEKFNFFDIDLDALLAHAAPGPTLCLHLGLAGPQGGVPAARLLGGLNRAHLRLFCTPVVNLFDKTAVPLALTHRTADYALVPDAEHAWAYDIHSIDSVRMVHQAGAAQKCTDYLPFHTERHHGAGEGRRHYWIARRDEAAGARAPGHEVRIAFVDGDCTPHNPGRAKASIELTCTNRDLPGRLPHGAPEGDLQPLNGKAGTPLRLLKRPTRTHRHCDRGGAHWRLISHLTLNHRSLAQDGVPSLREALDLFDPAQSAQTHRQIMGIVGLSAEPAVAWLRGKGGAALVDGMRITLRVDEDAFVGSGVHAFGQMLDRYFGLYVQVNHFSELVLVSDQSGKELIHCKPRNGNLQIA